MTSPLLEIDDLTIQYRTDRGWLTAVSDASLTLDENEYFGIVGESGCGKTTLAKSIIGGLDSNARIESGTIKYRGEDVHDLSESELRNQIRWSEISWIPQSAMNSLDPLQRVGDQAVEVAKAHTDWTRAEALEEFERMFGIVGLPSNRIMDYPFQFSGGMQQRAIIALALFLKPSIIIADEPTTALDVIMQDQVLKYFDAIRDETDTSMIMITHDISLVFETCDSMAVMHGGQVAETGSVTSVYDSPKHPYAILLQRAFPDIRYPDRDLETIAGDPPQQLGEVTECSFVDRCPWAVSECSERAPPLESVDGEEHRASCFRKDEVHSLYEQERREQALTGE